MSNEYKEREFLEIIQGLDKFRRYFALASAEYKQKVKEHINNTHDQIVEGSNVRWNQEAKSANQIKPVAVPMSVRTSKSISEPKGDPFAHLKKSSLSSEPKADIKSFKHLEGVK